MATESTEEHEKIKPLLIQEQIPFTIQCVSKQSLYRALGHSYKIFPPVSMHFSDKRFFAFIFLCPSVDSVAINNSYTSLSRNH